MTLGIEAFILIRKQNNNNCRRLMAKEEKPMSTTCGTKLY